MAVTIAPKATVTPAPTTNPYAAIFGVTNPSTGYLTNLNPAGSPNFLAGYQPNWNIATTPYAGALAQAKSYILTPSQGRNTAAQQATAQTNAALTASNASSSAEQAQLGSQMNRAAGIAQALGSYGPEYANAMSSAYGNAANTIAQLGPGAIQAGGSTLQAASDAASQAAAAKTGGQGQVSSYNVPDIVASLTQTGVNMPGNSLAVAGVNAAQAGLSAAQSDKQYVMSAVYSYQQQAVNALNQRAAERAQIIAQKPELFQSALEAQRQDEYQTQNRYDSVLSNATNYLASKNQMGLGMAQAQTQWALGQMAATHINPYTGQPVGGYTWGDKAHTFVEAAGTLQTNATNRMKAKAYVSHFDDMAPWYAARTKQANAAANAHSSGMTTYSDSLSKQVGHLVDSKGNPFLTANKQQIPYTAVPGTGSKLQFKADGGLTANAAASYGSRIKSQIKDWATGNSGKYLYEPKNPNAPTTGPTAGFITRPGTATPALNYHDALNQALQLAPNAQWTKRITSWVQQQYPEGKNGRPFSTASPAAIASATKVVQSLYKSGMPYQEALAHARSNNTYPPGLAESVLTKIYYGGAYSPIKGSPHFGTGQAQQ